MAHIFHAYQIALDTDRLPVWVMILIGVATIGTGIALERSRYRWKRKVMVGFRSGALMGLLASSLTAGLLAFVSYRTLMCGAVKCIGRRCRGYNFTDLLGHRHYSFQHFVSMTFQPIAFWINYAYIALFTVVALYLLFGCIRSTAHWRELD
ncbi:hypothetical protein RHOFW104T7_02805 [Rhodanobacter thiooxydans]|uniref:Uncharacterized protein n=2 Tax=Rhodanobacter thiooxydans TaxID=416169 RepID=A0A154QDF5_9GAMM|nr:hypothetical protein [Rhodanobacter thiooxydans]EIM02459.1 hypothetical protein UUA_01981 [Rhodanobacter thiooxydans LCS2]KZC22003.1 hypothetical protein RHOFW104T7_02805 [Rhodanobacter thiooxydans]